MDLLKYKNPTNTTLSLWKNFKNEISFVSFEQGMKRKIYVKVWFVRLFSVIFICIIFDNFLSQCQMVIGLRIQWIVSMETKLQTFIPTIL
jgi:hypothetical protein